MIDPQKIRNWLAPFKETSIAPLIVFRIIFGALMLFGAARFLSKGWVEQLYIQPSHYFGYLGFEWVKPLTENWMYLPFVLLLISSTGILLGFLYRYCAILFFLCFTYIELLDKSNYLNHYYFVSLIAFLMIFLPANRSHSIDVLISPEKYRKMVPKWTLGILKFQLAVVYIFAGIAKINPDWLLEAQPLKTWLQANQNLPVIGNLFQEEWIAYLFSWFGCFYDLFIVFFLFIARTRPFAYFAVVVFHFLTWMLFPIGMFPWVMIFSTLIFFSDSFHQKVLSFLPRISKNRVHSESQIKSSNGIKFALVIYVFFQLIVPIRHLFYPGDVFWNEEGFRFSWRVMLMHKEGHATFYLFDQKTGRESEINNADFLTQTQEDQMATQPDMILQYAQLLKKHYYRKTLYYGNQRFFIENPEIRAKIYVSLNGRPSQLFVDKKHDLSSQPYNLGHRTWLEPFKQ